MGASQREANSAMASKTATQHRRITSACRFGILTVRHHLHSLGRTKVGFDALPDDHQRQIEQPWLAELPGTGLRRGRNSATVVSDQLNLGEGHTDCARLDAAQIDARHWRRSRWLAGWAQPASPHSESGRWCCRLSAEPRNRATGSRPAAGSARPRRPDRRRPPGRYAGSNCSANIQTVQIGHVLNVDRHAGRRSDDGMSGWGRSAPLPPGSEVGATWRPSDGCVLGCQRPQSAAARYNRE